MFLTIDFEVHLANLETGLERSNTVRYHFCRLFRIWTPALCWL